MAPRQGLRFDLDGPDSLYDVMRKLTELGKGRKVIENAVMRDLSGQAAERLKPIVEAGIRRSPAPQAEALAATVRTKRDRMIVLRVGATNPKLSGMRRSAGNKQWRGSLAWGVAVGPGPRRAPFDSAKVKAHRVAAHSRDGATVRKYRRQAHSRAGGNRAPTNVYGVARSGNDSDPFSGYLSGMRDKLEKATISEYADIVIEVCRRNGWPIT